MEEAVFDTNQHIDLLKRNRLDAKRYTTIFNVLEFPKAVQFKQLNVIFPTVEDYDESLKISAALLKEGTPLPEIDIIISAICITRNLPLSTKDRHFHKIKTIREAFRLQLQQ